ncbi:unnamed protein product [Hymenolepis diminuta]|uniref:Uncharacterized protein n=1 Tax=Hymenolepis diminuta TaxID=6216 RepID=A0A564XW71_HYMDI|nr:unnamed protein product [Hymenolepis diminuta]
MNRIEIINPGTISESFSHFRGMRVQRELVVECVFELRNGEMDTHLMVTSAYFPVFRKHLSGNDVVHVRLSRFSFE